MVLGFSGGMSIGKHLCEGEVVSKAINFDVKKCKKAAEAPLENNGLNGFIHSEPCCDTEGSFFKTLAFEMGSVFELQDIALEPVIHKLTNVPDVRPNIELVVTGLDPPRLSGLSLLIRIERFLI